MSALSGMDKLLFCIVIVSVIQHSTSILQNKPYSQNEYADRGVNFHPHHGYPRHRPDFTRPALDSYNARHHDTNHGHHDTSYRNQDIYFGRHYHRPDTQSYGQRDLNDIPQFGHRWDSNENLPYPRQSWNEYHNHEFHGYPPAALGWQRFWLFPGETPPWQPPSRPPPPPQRPPSTPATNTNSASFAITSCIKNCPGTSEYNPVCGTNNVTYTNSGRLNCAKFCGVDVEIKRASPCAQPMPVTTNPPLTIPDTENTPFNPNPTLSTNGNVIPTEPSPPEVTTEIDFQIDIRHPDE